MGLFGGFDNKKAYTAHVQGNKLIESGRIDEGREKHAEALKLYEKSRQNGSLNKASYMLAYGVLLLRYGKLDEAREVMLATEKMPGITAAEKTQLRINYSVCQWRMGNLDKAIELMKAAASAGKSGMIYTTLGYYLIEKAIQTGDFTEAVEFNREAYEYDDEDPATLDNFGQLNLAQGNREEAYKYFKKAHEIKPAQTSTLYFLAKMNHEDGNDEEADKLITRALNGNYSALCSVTYDQSLALKKEIDAAK